MRSGHGKAIRRHFHHTASLVLLCGLAAGCRDRSGGGTGSFAADAAPVQLETTLESARATTKRIATDGGTITATASDGTQYRLQIPRDALLSVADITLTPVRSVRGLPGEGEAVAAVQVEPEGLQLMKPAVLTIRGKHEIPAEEQVAIGWFASGADAHLHPFAVERGRIELQLLHFSGYGFGRYPVNDPGRQALQRAVDAGARLESGIAEALKREESRGVDGTSEELTAELESLNASYYDDVLRGLMRTAEGDDRMAECALQRYFAWIRNVQLYGLDADAQVASPEFQRRLEEAEKSAIEIGRNYYERARDRARAQCAQHDFSFAQTMFSAERQAQLLGDRGKAEYRRFMESVSEVIRECLQFELHFESRFEYQWPNGGGTVYAVRATVPVLSDAVQPGQVGSGPITYSDFQARGNPGTALLGRAAAQEAFLHGTIAPAGTKPGTLTVYDLKLDINPKEEPGVDCAGRDAKRTVQQINAIEIVFSPGEPHEIVRYTNRSRLQQEFGDPAEDVFTAVHYDWVESWSRWHAGEEVRVPGVDRAGQDPAGPRYRIGAYRLLLTRSGTGEWQARYDNPEAGENSLVVLRHTPR